MNYLRAGIWVTGLMLIAYFAQMISADTATQILFSLRLLAIYIVAETLDNISYYIEEAGKDD